MQNRTNKIAASHLLCLGVLLALFAPVASATPSELVGVQFDTGDLYLVPMNNVDSLQLIGSTGIAGLASLETSPSGDLYGFTSGLNPNLYLIDPVLPSNTSLIGALNLQDTAAGDSFAFEGGLAFADNGLAYATNGVEQFDPVLFTIDLATGTSSYVGQMVGNHDIDGLAWYDGSLIGLDRVTNAIVRIDPTTAAVSTLFTVDPTIGSIGGMVLGANGQGYFNTGGPQASTAAGSNELWSFDLTTNDHAFVRSLDGAISGQGISGLALAPIPEPATLALLAAGSLAFLRRRRR